MRGHVAFVRHDFALVGRGDVPREQPFRGVRRGGVKLGCILRAGFRVFRVQLPRQAGGRRGRGVCVCEIRNNQSAVFSGRAVRGRARGFLRRGMSHPARGFRRRFRGWRGAGRALGTYCISQIPRLFDHTILTLFLKLKRAVCPRS
jgi:hypothetical protein